MQSDLSCAERNAASTAEVEEFAAEPLATGRPVAANYTLRTGRGCSFHFLTIGARRVET